MSSPLVEFLRTIWRMFTESKNYTQFPRVFCRCCGREGLSNEFDEMNGVYDGGFECKKGRGCSR